MSTQPVGPLLAAGLGTRFDPGGRRLKLLEPVASGPEVDDAGEVHDLDLPDA